MNSEASFSHLHCSVCRQHITKLANLRFPACRHLFCSTCFDAQINLVSGRFQCPIDYCDTDPCSDRFEEINSAVEVWLRSYHNQDEKALQISYLRVRRCVNFVLVPCSRPAGHTDFDSCPYDHSLYTCSSPQYREVNYCPKCHVNSKHTDCPRCGSLCEHRQVRKSTTSPAQLYHRVMELPYVKLRNC